MKEERCFSLIYMQRTEKLRGLQRQKNCPQRSVECQQVSEKLLFFLLTHQICLNILVFKRLKKNHMTEYKKKCIYIRVAKNKAKIYKFLSKQRFKLSAALLKICQGDLTLWASGRLEFENQWVLEQEKCQVFSYLIKDTIFSGFL